MDLIDNYDEEQIFYFGWDAFEKAANEIGHFPIIDADVRNAAWKRFNRELQKMHPIDTTASDFTNLPLPTNEFDKLNDLIDAGTIQLTELSPELYESYTKRLWAYLRSFDKETE